MEGVSDAKDTTVATVKGSELHTMTPAGAAYVEKKIHPPAPTPIAYKGRPSLVSQEVCNFQTTGETDITPVFYFREETKYPDKIIFLSVPGGRVSNYVFFGYADDSFVQQTAINVPVTARLQPPACLLAGYDWDLNYNRDVGSHYMDYKSTTVYCNGTAFNKQGLISTAIFKPDIVTVDISRTLPTLASSICPKSRVNLARALGAPLLKSVKHKRRVDMEDGYDIIDDDVTPVHDFGAFASFRYQMINWGTQEATTEDIGGQLVIKGLFPKDVGEIQLMSRNTATRPFTDGAFIVERDSQETQEFIPRPILGREGDLAAQDLVVCLMTWYNPNLGTTYYYPLMNRMVTTSGELVPFSSDIPWSNLTCSMTMLQGLTVPSTNQVGTNGLVYASIKTICGYTVQPAPKSSLRVFMTELPMPDRPALDMVAVINRQRPDSMPANANDAGTIMTAILALAPSVISFLSSAFKSKKKTTVENAPAPKKSNEVKQNFRPPGSKPSKSPKMVGGKGGMQNIQNMITKGGLDYITSKLSGMMVNSKGGTPRRVRQPRMPLPLPPIPMPRKRAAPQPAPRQWG